MKIMLSLLVVFMVRAAVGQQTFGTVTDGPTPESPPPETSPCFRFPHRLLANKRFNLQPQFDWWRANYQAYQQFFSSADPKGIATNAPAMPGWHRIKAGHFIRAEYYGWLCDAVIEDVPTHTVTNQIIIWAPPENDKARWDALVERYDDLSAAAANRAANRAAGGTGRNNGGLAGGSGGGGTSRRMRNNAANAGPATTPDAAQAEAQALIQAQQPPPADVADASPESLRKLPDVVAALSKFPLGTNYTIDLFALKRGYRTGTHIPVYQVGLMP